MLLKYEHPKLARQQHSTYAYDKYKDTNQKIREEIQNKTQYLKKKKQGSNK